MVDRTPVDSGPAAAGVESSPRAVAASATIETQDEGGGARDAAEPEVGSVVGRYVVLARVGAGALGVVLAAYDPELDRKVAIKLLHTTRGDVEQAALLDEARALARLSHPNVVAIHDVGTHDRRAAHRDPTLDGSPPAATSVFIAMEFVRGETLRAWARRPRPWPEVLAVMLDVGEGLAAAHAAGLVHRDLKPDNIMVSEDRDAGPAKRRVRVMDFGLARAADAELRGSSTGSGSRSIGSPAYMAPEAIAGLDVDARTDQFAFCVTLHELLYGVRPHGGDTIAAVTAAITLGELRDPPATAGVPAWLRRIVLHGLATEPARRFASMRELLEALRVDPTRARRPRLVVGGLAVLVGGSIALAGWSRHRESTRCRDPVEQLAGAWGPSRGEEITAAFASTRLRYADDVATHVVDQLDAWTQRWLDINEPGCLGRPAGVPTELRAAQAVCLAGRRRELAALVEILTHPDATVVEQAIDALGDLPRPESCAEPEYLAAAVKPPEDPELAAAVEDARRELATVNALRSSGKYDESLARAKALRERAETAAHAPLLAEVLLALGQAEEQLGHFSVGADALAQAYEVALGVGSDEIAVAAAMASVHAHGELGAIERAESWLPSCRALSRRLGDPPLTAATVLRAQAIVLLRKEDLDGARVMVHEAIAVLGDAATDADIAALESLLGTIAFVGGEFGPALEHSRRALAADERSYGPNHPKIMQHLSHVANARHGLGDNAGALAEYSAALAIAEGSLGLDHPSTALVLNNTANVLRVSGDLPRAKAYLLRALDIRERKLGPDHPHVGATLANLAFVLEDEGDVAGAAALLERGRAILERRLGPSHTMVMRANHRLARLVASQGELVRALALMDPACAGLRQTMGPQATESVSCDLDLADVLAQRGDDEAARLRLALVLPFAARRGDRTTLPRAQFVEARLEWARGDHEHARTLARAALDELITGTPDSRGPQHEIERWLARRP